MTPKVCKLLLLIAAAALPAGCASSHESADDSTPVPAMEAAPNPMPEHDDSHGWGANVQNVSGQGAANRQ
jgi:hypothetical protein